MVRKNSLASDFMTSAIRGREGVADGAFWHAVPAAPMTLARAKSIRRLVRPSLAGISFLTRKTGLGPAEAYDGSTDGLCRLDSRSGSGARRMALPPRQPVHPRPWPRHRLLCALR